MGQRLRAFIKAMPEAELETALRRRRYACAERTQDLASSGPPVTGEGGDNQVTEQQGSIMTRNDTPALDQLRCTNNLITVAAAANSDIVFGYILKRPPADIDRLWYQALVLGPAEPFSGYLVAACFEGPNSGLCVLPDGRTSWSQTMPTLPAATNLCTRWAETLAQAAVAEWHAHALGDPQP